MKRDRSNWVVTGKDRDDAYSGILAGFGLIVLGVVGLAAWGFVWWLSLGLVVFGAACIWGANARLRGDV